MVARSLYLTALPIASGILLALAMPPVDWSWLIWIALVPLGLAMTERRSQIELYIGAYFGGVLFQWIHCDWMRTVTGGATLSYDRVGQWLAQGLAFALPWPLALAAGRVLARSERSRMALVLPLVWVSFEYLRWHGGWLLDLTGFPWGQIGMALNDYPRLMQVASLAGVFGVGAIIAMVNGAIVDLARGRGRTSVAAPFAVLVACAAFGQWELGTPFRAGPSVCLMPDEPNPHDALDRVATSPRSADILLWSEAWFPSAPIEELQAAADQAQMALVVGCTREEDDSSFNSVAMFVPGRPFQGFYDKTKLVPFSEFHPPHMPSFDKDFKNRYQHGRTYPSFDLGCCRAAALVCYDVCFPSAARQFVLGAKRPDLLLVPSYEAHDTSGCVQRGTLRHAQFRAIECRTTIVRNVVGGTSGVIDGNGQPVVALASIDQPTRIDSVPIDSRRSVYAMVGDWLPRLSLVIVATLVCLRAWQGSESRSRPSSTPRAA